MNTQHAIDLAGSAKALADLFGITASAVSQWNDELPDGRVWQLRVIRPAWFEPDATTSKSKQATQVAQGV